MVSLSLSRRLFQSLTPLKLRLSRPLPRGERELEHPMADQYDLIVLGSGPGGYVAAIRAAQLGLKTAIVERELLGGICLNWGCIPTKALLRTAEVYHYLTHAEAYGLSNEKPSFDIAKVVARSRAVAKQLNQGVTHLMKKNKIAVVMGEGKLTGKGKLSVTGADGKATDLAAKHIIVATGARARELPFAKSDGKRIWTYRHAMTPPEMPAELLVLGSGALGIGDVTAPPWLAHKAMHEGVTTAEAIARELGNKDVHPHAADPKNIPGCTYCRPQVASVGLTEAAAKEKGYQVKVGKFPAIGNGKAIALGEVEGFVKTVFDAKTGELLGAHMIGAEVTELIQGYTVGKTAELIDEDFVQTVFPHPTLSEMMHEAVLAADGRVLHI